MEHISVCFATGIIMSRKILVRERCSVLLTVVVSGWAGLRLGVHWVVLGSLLGILLSRFLDSLPGWL